MLYYYHANKSKFHLTPNNIYDYLLSGRPRRVFCTDIAWTTTVTQRTAVPRSSFHYCLCVNADWVATAVFSFITPHRTSKDDRRKSQIDDFSNLIDIFRTNSIQVLNLHGFLCRLGLCHSNDILKIKEKKLLALGPSFRDRESLGTKQTQIKPNANKGLPIKPVNHIQPQLSRLCPKSSWTPTSQNADGATHSGGFNAMYTKTGESHAIDATQQLMTSLSLSSPYT